MDDLIRREDAIKIFSQLWDCIDEIADKEEWEDVCKTTANELPSAQQWVPVTERLPEKDGDYLVFAKWDIEEDYNVQIIPFDSCVEQFGYLHEYFDMHTLGSLGSEFEPVEVKAWMSLPKPWKESEDDE